MGVAQSSKVNAISITTHASPKLSKESRPPPGFALKYAHAVSPSSWTPAQLASSARLHGTSVS